MAQVELTSHLHQFFPALKDRALEIPAETVKDVIDGIEAIAPGFRFYVCDELGRLRQHVNVFVDKHRVTDRATLTDPLRPESRVFILQALSGG